MSKKAKFKVIVKELITYEFLAVEDENFPVNDYNLNYIDGDDLNLDVEGWGVKKITPKKQIDIESVSITYEDVAQPDKPEEGKQYLLTGAPGQKCIANGNTWKESEIKK